MNKVKTKIDSPKILAVKEVQTFIGLVTVTEIEFVPRKFNAVEWAELTKYSQGTTGLVVL